MNFRDHWAVNSKGERFIFTVEMQRRLSEAGLPVEPDALELLNGRQSIGRQATEQRSGERRPSERETPSHEQAEARPEIVGPETIQIDPMTGKYIGRIKWYNMKKGYGFILRGGDEEIFFHRSGAVGDPVELLEGQWVLYDVEDTDKGPEATDVEPYEERESDQ